MRQKIKLKEQTALERWSVDMARELYGLKNWGKGFFDINGKGNVIVLPHKNRDHYLDIKELVDELRMRDITPPILIRFTDILKQRIDEIQSSFQQAMHDYGYGGGYLGAYPVKVNQSKEVVEDIIEFGRPYRFGLEAGSKPELLIAVASLDTPGAPIVCNGYKDTEFIEIALWAQKLGRLVLIVVEKPSELDIVIQVARRLKVRPVIGIRAKLAARGKGKWEGSGGDRSKFGLFPSEILEAIQKLERAGMLDCLQLLHFHLGSQITAIQSIKDALRESTRLFAEMMRLGVGIRYFDVGGGLAVDYDGSMTNFSSSANYTLLEYASDVVSAISETCAAHGLPHPTIISESGRALVAYHSVLVFNVLGTSEFSTETAMPEIPAAPPEPVSGLLEILRSLSVKNFQESYHDAIQARDEALTLFNVGMLSLEARATAERLFWLICVGIAKIVRGLDYVPDEFEHLDSFVSDIYYGNLSIFQSLPDHWAVKQLFPVVPIHRLQERPTRKATFADITCDSDGKIDQFIDLRDVRNTIDLHELRKDPYHVGVFLVGAYQEVLGDLHNLFGDTHTVHVSITGKNTYRIDKIVEGDTVRDALAYMQYQKRDIMTMFRRAVEESIERKRITIKESARIQKFLEEGLEGYTYLE
ncbi:MAG: biosynthetic arginine decarboxylase [Candidatus Eisenbacteria bacterium]|nr:biosynthetic arginine decarboxylase [Candidatus Eisenbacteria bacterium]